MKEMIALAKVIADLQRQNEKLQATLELEKIHSRRLGVKLDQAYDVLLDHQINPDFLCCNWYSRELPF